MKIILQTNWCYNPPEKKKTLEQREDVDVAETLSNISVFQHLWITVFISAKLSDPNHFCATELFILSDSSFSDRPLKWRINTTK